MSKVGQSVLRGARDAIEFVRGEKGRGRVQKFDPLDVAVVRARLGLSQTDFAKQFGLSIDAVRNWEQGRRQPDQAAKSLLKIIAYEPDAAVRALAR